jgi:hypothetical protein
MTITATVSFRDPTGEFAAFYPLLTSNTVAAAHRWGEFLTTDASLEIEISFLGQARGATASAEDWDWTRIGNWNGLRLFENGPVHELLTGVDPNGSAFDLRIDINPDALLRVLWLDPTPEDHSAPPRGMADGLAVLMHEIGHGLGFTSMRNRSTGQFGRDASVYDTFLTNVDGLFYFTGPAAVATYGGPVPLTSANFSHYGNRTPNPGSDLVLLGLMNGVSAGGGGQVWDISALDLAILQDLGLPIRSLNSVIGTKGNDLLKGLGGPDVVRSRVSDTIDGDAGFDTAVFTGNRSTYAITQAASGYDVSVNSASQIHTAVTSVERLQFADTRVSLDLGDGDPGGMTARLIGAAFDRSNLVPSLAGAGIRLFEQGHSFLEVAQMAINTDLFLSLAGSHSNVDFVNAVYRNIVGTLANTDVRDSFVRLLQGSGGTMSQAELLLLAAYAPENAVNVDLVGIQRTGLDFA